MFDHLKNLDVKRDSLIWLELPECGPKARVQLRPATEANPIYFNAMMKRAGARARKLARTDRLSLEDAAQNRAEDRELFPLYVIAGWEEILDSERKPVPFSLENSKEFCEKLPDWLFDRVRNAAATSERFLPEGTEPPDAMAVAKN